MLRMWLIIAIAVSSLGCLSASPEDRFDCPEEVLADWHIPAGWMVKALTPTEARVEVLTANLSKEACEARWETLRDQWREGDSYWLYRRPDEDTINALGAQQGVVLVRGCDQLGFVTTRIETEEPGAQRG
jgi:hypothetical protein